MMLITFLVTLVLGIEEGVLAGVVVSIAMVLYETTRPHFAVLGKLPNSATYRNIERFEHVDLDDEVLVIRFDNQLYFANANYFLDTIKDLAVAEGEVLKLVVLDASSIHDIDSTGIHALEELLQFLSNRGVKLYLAGVIGPVRDLLQLTGLADRIGEKSQFLRTHDAVVYFQNSENGTSVNWSPDALQSNVEGEA